jgi:CRP-like cAMP-binding protein
MTENYIHTLKSNRLFEGIDITELQQMLGCIDPRIREYGKNDFIALAGEKFDSIGIIANGSAAVIKEDVNGNRVIMTLLKPGDMFGEMAAFSNRPVWPASVYVQEKCTAFFIPSIKIVSSCKSACPWHTILIQNLLKTISEKALLLNRKVEYLSIKSMRGRISAFLLEQYKRTGGTTFTIPMDRNELADFLNVSRPSMSREMCKMRDEGLIDFHRSSVRLKNIAALSIDAE